MSESRHLAILIQSLSGGGVQRMMLTLAEEFARQGHTVDLLVCNSEGDLAGRIPASVNLVELKPVSAMRARLDVLRADPQGLKVLLRPVLLPIKTTWVINHLVSLAAYLEESRPDVLLSGWYYINLLALWAKKLARVETRVVISARVAMSVEVKRNKWSLRFLPALLNRVYPWADEIISVSNCVADDLAATAHLSRDRIRTIYNPVVSERLFEMASKPVEHPWLQASEVPLVLAVGRFMKQKDFPTLLRAFARLREQRQARLIILGDGKQRAELESLASDLGISDSISLPGFTDNPYAWMSRASVFVLSSLWEGLPGVLIQAMACGCPVVSTDCLCGPAEILDNGKYGPIIPMGNDLEMAKAIMSVLDSPGDRGELISRAQDFNLERSVAEYTEVLGLSNGE